GRAAYEDEREPPRRRRRPDDDDWSAREEHDRADRDHADRDRPPLQFNARIKTDPHKTLKGAFAASASAAGLTLRKGKQQVDVPVGTPARHVTRNTIEVELEGRPVELTIARLGWYQDRLARDPAAWLSPRKSGLDPDGYALPWYLFAAALLPAGIPIITLGGAIPAGAAALLIRAGLAVAQLEPLSQLARLL